MRLLRAFCLSLVGVGFIGGVAGADGLSLTTPNNAKKLPGKLFAKEDAQAPDDQDDPPTAFREVTPADSKSTAESTETPGAFREIKPDRTESQAPVAEGSLPTTEIVGPATQAHDTPPEPVRTSESERVLDTLIEGMTGGSDAAPAETKPLVASSELAPQAEAAEPQKELVEAEPAKEAPVEEKAAPVEEKLTAKQIALRSKIRRVLGAYYARPENTNDHTPWGVMHSLISFGVDTRIYHQGRRINAVGFLCWNYTARGQQIMYLRNGQLNLRVGPGVQGHEGQLLAMLAQSKVSRSYPIRVNGVQMTVEDLINYEKRTCRAKSELTFKLIGLSHYLDSDATWRCDRGQTWNIERLIREELQQTIVGAACGGTHRMMGFAYAVNRRKLQGKPITGQFLRAEKFVVDYQRYTFALQNADGSFSTEWFERRANKPDEDRKVQTTGHLLEWMVFSLPEESLDDRRLVRCIDFLADLLQDNQHRKLEIGPKGHALRALVLYDQRRFGGQLGLGAGSELERLWAQRVDNGYSR